MRHRKQTPVVGLFVEGRLRDQTRDSIDTLWEKLADKCEALHTLKVYGIDKGQIVSLKPETIPKREGATKILPRQETVDIAIDRALREDALTHVIIAFDAWPPNELIHPNGRRQEIGYLLTGLKDSRILPDSFKTAAGGLAERYATSGCLDPRDGDLGVLEVLYMEPMFEALLVSDEACVRRACGHSAYPKDWPKFKTTSRQLDKHVMAPAVAAAHKDVLRKMGGEYLDRKTAWALRVIEHADSNAQLWRQEIALRLCRILCNLSYQ